MLPQLLKENQAKMDALRDAHTRLNHEHNQTIHSLKQDLLEKDAAI